MKRILTVILAFCAAGVFSAKAQTVSFTGYYHQDFDSLENNGTSGDTLPKGWYFYENSTSNPTTYNIDNGSSNSGNTFSYGNIGSTDRAFGSLASGSNQPILGVAFTNNTGREVDTIRMVFKVEQWRIGNTGAARMDSNYAEISPFATSLSDVGVWQRIPQLNWFSTVQTATTAAAIDGNTNYTLVDQTFTGLNIPAGATIWIRWSDPNIGGSDDGLAIDSFTMEIPAPVLNPVVSFTNKTSTITEGDSVMVSLKISNPNANATSVIIDIDNASTATAGSDYTFTSGNIYTFAANSLNNIDVWIKTTDDNAIEGSEMLKLMLSNPNNNATLGDSVLTITINDNDFPTYKIGDLKNVNGSGFPDSSGVRAWIKGIVQSPTFRPGALEFSLQDSTGGTMVFKNPGNFGYVPSVGDSVMVLGTVVNFNGLTEFSQSSTDTLIKLSSTGFAIAPQVVTAFNEMYEGSLVSLENVSIIDDNQWTGSGSGFNVDVTNGTDTMQIRIDADVDLYAATAPTGKFNVTGILTQFDNSAPYTEGYQLLPRSSADIELIIEEVPEFPEYKIAELKGVNANGEADSVGVKAWIRGVVQSPTFRPGALEFSLQDNTGGIMVFKNPGNFGYVPSVGDSIKVLGTVVNFNGLTEFSLSATDTLIKLNTAGSAIAAKTITSFTEVNEGSLVKLMNVTIIDDAQWTGSGSGFNVDVTNGTDTFQIRIDADVDLYAAAAPTGKFNVTGVLTQFDNSAPYTEGYQLLPRSDMDIEATVGIKETNAVHFNISIYPNPAASYVNIKTDDVADAIIVTDVTGKILVNYAPQSISEQINVSAFKAGLYFVKIQKNGNISTQKLYKH